MVITFNEEANIQRCLKSVPFADDIVVVDSYSTDQTVALATAAGARVVQEKWRGFGPQKKFATSLAKNDWILSLDADEALSPELASELYECFSDLDPSKGYLLPRRSYHLGRWIRFGGWYPDYQLKLFNKSRAAWTEAEVHESIQVPQKAKLQRDVLHWVFEDLSDQVKTNDRYSSLGAQQMWAQGKRFSYLKLCFKPLGKFVETYIVKQGFRDGLPGFIIAVGAAYSLFLKFAKLWELERGNKKSQG